MRLFIRYAKWAILFVIGMVALQSVDISAVFGNVRSFSPQTLLVFWGLVALSHIFYDMRFLLIASSLGIRSLSPQFVIRLNLLSEFVSIVLPSYVAGDGLRLLRLQPFTDTRTAAACVFTDRIVGLLTLVVATLLYLPSLSGVIQLPVQINVPLAIACGVALSVGGVLAVRFAPTIITKLGLSHVRLRLYTLAWAGLLSLIGHLLFSLSYIVLLLSLINAVPLQMMAVTLTALLTRSVPVSFLGAEFSDGSFVALTGLLGISTTNSLTVITVAIGTRYFFGLIGICWEIATSLPLRWKNLYRR